MRHKFRKPQEKLEQLEALAGPCIEVWWTGEFLELLGAFQGSLAFQNYCCVLRFAISHRVSGSEGIMHGHGY